MIYKTISYVTSEKGILMLREVKLEGCCVERYYSFPEAEIKSCRGIEYKDSFNCAMDITKKLTGVVMTDPKLKGVILFDNQEMIFPDEYSKQSQNVLVYIYTSVKHRGKLKKIRPDESGAVWIYEDEWIAQNKNEEGMLLCNWFTSYHFKEGRNFMGVIRTYEDSIDLNKSFVNWMG